MAFGSSSCWVVLFVTVLLPPPRLLTGLSFVPWQSRWGLSAQMNVTLALSAAAAEWVKRMSTSLGRRREKLRPAGD